MQKERPILFSGPMVRAILEGRKSQTRRVVKHSPDSDCPYHENGVAVACPYGKPGDRLWVRETWKTCEIYNPYAPSQLDSASAVQWLADGGKRLNGTEQWGKTRVSIHMPKWASRIMLEVVSVRVERLQDISEADAKEEGCAGEVAASISSTPSTLEYEALWESLNGPGSWEKNPWVWVVEFKRVQ